MAAMSPYFSVMSVPPVMLVLVVIVSNVTQAHLHHRSARHNVDHVLHAVHRVEQQMAHVHQMLSLGVTSMGNAFRMGHSSQTVKDARDAIPPSQQRNGQQ